MKSRHALTILSIGLVSLLLAACNPSSATPTASAPVYKVVSEGTLKKGDAIPVPTGDVILTVTGLTEAHNVDKSIQMDLATIESVGLVDYAVNDPFDEEDDKLVTFQGVLMSKLLDLWQVPASAKTLHMVALNDYSIDVPIQDMRDYPVIFALKSEGKYMLIADRGPAMLVYPYTDFPFDPSVYDNYWIWQIASIEVR